MENETVQTAVPLSMNVDLQLGPDGHPWIRYQLGTPALTTTFVIPLEHLETFITWVTDKGRATAKKALSRQADIIVPDFTGLKVASEL